MWKAGLDDSGVNTDYRGIEKCVFNNPLAKQFKLDISAAVAAAKAQLITANVR
jgi:hypothetical protein